MGTVVNRDKLPRKFPTHMHADEFWAALGRTVATFGFLEEILGKAIFAFTATREYEPTEIVAAYKAWLPKLEKALTDQLYGLAEVYEKAVRENPKATIENVCDLVGEIKSAAKVRNVLCHGSWGSPNADGQSVPFFVNRQNEIWITPIDVKYLDDVQAHVVGLICSVVDSVTHSGFQFPGSSGPGQALA